VPREDDVAADKPVITDEPDISPQVVAGIFLRPMSSTRFFRLLASVAISKIYHTSKILQY
jgi:hypothetical protein